MLLADVLLFADAAQPCLLADVAFAQMPLAYKSLTPPLKAKAEHGSALEQPFTLALIKVALTAVIFGLGDDNFTHVTTVLVHHDPIKQRLPLCILLLLLPVRESLGLVKGSIVFRIDRSCVPRF